MRVIDYIRSKSHSHQPLICALFVTSIFSLRWINCLPFSGYMPVISDGDNLTLFGHFLVYAKEPFTFPIGLIKGFSFPLEITNISKGSIPLFAIPLKLLSRYYPASSEFYYFVTVELVSVFATAYFAVLILRQFGVDTFSVQLLGSVLCTLSFSLLYRSSEYYRIPFVVTHFPLYLAGAYLLIRLVRQPSFKSLLLFISLFCIVVLIENSYLLFGVAFMACVASGLYLLEFLENKTEYNRKRFVFLASGVAFGLLLAFGTMLVVGQQFTTKLDTGAPSVLADRNSSEWGYGGGYGGGFHVADAFSLIVPPGEGSWDGISGGLPTGTTSYLTKLGFPITTDDLQAGQYEGFAYLGTIIVGLLCGLILTKLILCVCNPKLCFSKFSLKWISMFYGRYNFCSLPFIFGVSTFALYMMSWGYILHVFGTRLNDILTPSFMLAAVWPKFLLVRSLGRFAIPFVLYITVMTVIWLDGYLVRYVNYRWENWKRHLVPMIVLLLTLGHIFEIRGYLKPPEVIYGNDIAKIFDQEDILSLHELLLGKKALMFVPSLRTNFRWKMIGNSLAFHSSVPTSGTNTGFWIRREDRNLLNGDISTILMGNIRGIINKYGDIAIAAPTDIAAIILKRTNIDLKYHKMKSQNVVILTLT